MTAHALQTLLGRTVRYGGRPARVEHVRLTWRRVMPPIEEVALVPLDDPTTSPRWVNLCDIDAWLARPGGGNGMMRCPQCLQLIGVSTATGVCAACAPRES